MCQCRNLQGPDSDNLCCVTVQILIVDMFDWQRKRVCFSSDIQTMEIPRRRTSLASASSLASAADEMHRSRPTSRPVNRQLELPAQQLKGRLRSPLSATSPSRVSSLVYMKVSWYALFCHIFYAASGQNSPLLKQPRHKTALEKLNGTKSVYQWHAVLYSNVYMDACEGQLYCAVFGVQLKLAVQEGRFD